MSDEKNKAFGEAAEHLRTVSFALASASVVCLLVVSQYQPGATLDQLNKDIATLRSIYDQFGSLKSKVEVKRRFAEEEAQKLRGLQADPRADFTVAIKDLGRFKISMLQYLIYEPFTDGGMGYSRASLSGFGTGSTWGAPASESSLPDPTLADISDLWDRLDQSFEVVVPIGTPSREAWLSSGTIPVEPVDDRGPREGSREATLDRRPGEIPPPEKVALQDASDWGFTIRGADYRQEGFIPVTAKVVMVKPQLLAMGAAGAPERWTPGAFRTAFPSFFRRLGADAEKPASRLQATLEKDLEDSQDSAYFELAGFKIRQTLLNIAGLAILVAFQLYLWLHLRGFRSLGADTVRGNTYPWLALYPDRLARGVYAAFVGFLPLTPVLWAAMRVTSLTTGAFAVASLLLAFSTVVELRQLWNMIDSQPSPPQHRAEDVKPVD